MSETTRPPAAEQFRQVKALDDAGATNVDRASEGDTWWVVSLEWYNVWKAHVDWNNGGASPEQEDAPGPIDNSNLLAEDRDKATQRLKPGLSEGADYTVLPDSIYQLLVSWYTVDEVQAPGLRRKVTSVGENSIEVSIPVFDLLIASDIHPGGNPEQTAEVTLSKYQKLDTLVDSVVQQLLDNSVVSADEVPDMSNVRLWFSLGKGKPWHLVPINDEFTDTVMALAPPDSDTSVCRVPSPRLLVDIRPDADSPWIREDLDASEDLPAKEAKQEEEDAAAAAAVEAAALEAKKSLEQRERVAAMSDEDWRAALQPGWLMDVFDGKEWRETKVLKIPEGDDPDTLIVGFRAEPGHTLTTTRSAGASAAAGTTPATGDIAKPYSKVGDWRTQLRQDMRIECMGEKRFFYQDSSRDKFIHYHEGDKEWWLSDKPQFDIGKAHGYLYSKGTPDKPPVTTGHHDYQVYNGGRWIRSQFLHVEFAPNTFEGTPAAPSNSVAAAGKEAETKEDGASKGPGPELSPEEAVAAQKAAYVAAGGLPDLPLVRVFADEEFDGKDKDIRGMYRPMERNRWRKERVIRVDYKRRLLTITHKPSSVWRPGTGFYNKGYWIPGKQTISLDTDTIRKLQISGGANDADDDDLDAAKARATSTLCGLRNLGNTCFMNSILQCLFAVPPLSEFFVSKAQVDSMLNPSNPLGTGGELAKAFCGLVKSMAGSAGKTQIPKVFKQVLGNFAPRFAGFEQQDAMEFFNSLTDLLHEDLNRIQKKPYVESVESGSDPDDVVAKEAWRRHLLRNDSIIVDIFQGQFKSHLTCPNDSCKGKSWRKFDPFNAVPCPLPPAPKKKIVFEVVLCSQKGQDSLADFVPPKNPFGEGTTELDENGHARTPETAVATSSTPPGLCTLEVEGEKEGASIAAAISEKTGIPVERLLVVQLRLAFFDRVLFDPAHHISTSFYSAANIVVYELPEGYDPEKHLMVALRWGPKVPLLIQVSKSMTNRELHMRVQHLLRRRLLDTEEAVESAPLPPIERDDEITFPHPGTQVETRGVVLSTSRGIMVRPAGDVDEAGNVTYRSAMTYTINPEGAQHAFDFRKHAQEYLRAEGRWAAHPVAEGKEATPSGDSDSDNEEAPSTETKTTDGAGEEERPVWEVRPNRAYAVRYFKRDDDIYAVPGTVPTALRKNHMWRDIYWILPVDDEPVNPDIALLSLYFSPDLRLLVDHSFDAAVDTPEFWNPPKEPDADGEADEDDGALTLHKCLVKFSTREQLGAMDEWYCPGCKTHVQAFKKMDLWKLPQILVFHLKRFSYEVGQWATHREKLEDFVDFPFEIDMAPYLIGDAAEDESQKAAESANNHSNGGGGGGGGGGEGEEDSSSTLYELIAVSNHMGNLGFGHYTAFTKRGNQWYECDDSSVTRVAPEDIKTASAYVLFYRRVNAKDRAKAQAAADAAGTAGKAPNARQEDAHPMPPTLPDVSSDDDDSVSDGIV